MACANSAKTKHANICERNCPKCGKVIQYSDKYACAKAEKRGALCKGCANTGKIHSADVKQRLSQIRKGKHFSPKTEFKKGQAHGPLNLRYGISNYETWLQKYGKEEADKRQNEFKKKISLTSRGSRNPMYGKPAPQGSGNGWKGWYKGLFFRSLRELAYVIELDRNGRKWVTAECKKLEISYKDFNGNERTYRADFLVEDKFLIEIKPGKMHDTPTVNLKRAAAERFCEKQGLVYEIVDPKRLTGEEIKYLYDNHIIQWTEAYEKLYLERYA